MEFFNSVLIDFNYVFGNGENEKFIKELAVCPVGQINATTYHFKPPFPKKQLINNKSIGTNNFCKKKFNVNWDEGNLNYLQLDKIFDKLSYTYLKFYVKGLQKQKFLEQYLDPSTIYNLSNIFDQIPSLHKLPDAKMYCIKHMDGDCCPSRNITNLSLYVLYNK